jgi:hypothetical protein
LRATSTIRAATAAGLVALLLLAVAALPATAQSESSFGLSEQGGGDTSGSTTMLSGAEQTGGTTDSGATVELSDSTTGEATVIQPSESTAPSTAAYDQYQGGSLADTGGLQPLTMRLGILGFIAGAGLLFWRLVSARSTNHREDNDVYFG